MRVLLLLALVGCYSPGYRDCEVTCGGGSCPSGFVCNQGVCRVEGFSGACGSVAHDGGIDAFIDPAKDDDGDGVINANDNCVAVMNPKQENEDGDARGDACDPCPVDGAPGADDDDDGDGVGNGCDPEPTMQNHLDVFEGFNATTAPMGATLSGNWTFSGGQARSVPSGNEPAMIAWPEPSSPAVMVSAQFTINAFDATIPQNYVGVAHHINSSTVRCSLTTLSSGMLELVAQGQRFSSMPTPVNVGTTAVTYQTRIDMSFECAEAVTGTTITASMPGTIGVGLQAGFYSLAVPATLDWVVIVSRSP